MEKGNVEMMWRKRKKAQIQCQVAVGEPDGKDNIKEYNRRKSAVGLYIVHVIIIVNIL